MLSIFKVIHICGCGLRNCERQKRIHVNSPTRFIQSFMISILFITSIAACSGTLSTALPTPPALSEIASESLTIDLGDFQTKAELTHPVDGDGVYPTIILLHGSAPADMDYHRYSSWGEQELLSNNFLDIANYLTPRGFSVLRFNKHYVIGPQEVDWDKYSQNITLQLLLEDAEKVLAAAKANPHVDDKNIFILGWSEGSVIGAALSAQHPELAGLILQGPVTLPFRDSWERQVLDAGVPYLRSFSTEGRVTSDVIENAIVGSGGEVSKGSVWFFIDPVAAERGDIAINAELDLNGDGAISINDEFLPELENLLDIEFGESYMYASENALPSTTQQAANIEVPVLILQGENDSATAEKDVHLLEQALESADHSDYQLIIYPGLGHSLGPAETLIKDNFRPIEQRPLEDLVIWLRDHSR
jgi:pimeloyl-ACP methyl ester carboxylesterase